MEKNIIHEKGGCYIYLFNDVFVQQKTVKVSFLDRGFCFGDGVYELIKVYDGKLYAKEAHLHRLQFGLDEIRLPIPWTMEEISERMDKLVSFNRLKTGFVYLQITRGVSERRHAFPTNVQPTLIAYVKPFPRPLRNIKNGVKVITTEDDRWLRCNIKSLNLLPNVLAKQKATEKGATEAIYIRDHYVTEGASSNIFIVKNNTIHTHPSSPLILTGVTRNIVLDLAQQLQYQIKEAPFTQEDLLQADEIFMTGTNIEVMPVIVVNDDVIADQQIGEITTALQRAYERTWNEG
ncbi:D-amino-acid transaminase [Longirhabdus pacifica]|uniref:D-amino-acid transaminase n=1 Tax=Longirhabdus pacifica TaxID=2305227 RepID=UPI0023EA7321